MRVEARAFRWNGWGGLVRDINAMCVVVFVVLWC